MTFSPTRAISALALAPALALFAVTATGAPSAASVAQPTPVMEDPADFTPRVEPDATIARPHVDAFVRSGTTMYAGGLFGAVSDSAGATTVARTNMMSFDATTGVLTTFAPALDGPVHAVEATAGAVYVGGNFTTVDGVSRRSLVKIDPLTGAVDPAFDANFAAGQIYDIQLVGNRLFVAGTAGKKLMSLDPSTGVNTGYLNLAVRGKIEGSWGTTSVTRFAVNPQETQLAAVGNFTTVSGFTRQRAFVADLRSGSATLDAWYYNSLTKPCASTAAQRQAYLSDVDYSPDGSYFVVGSTGFTPLRASEIGETICDAVARFDVSITNPTRPVWINYTGGDSVWSVSATGAAVYVQGHIRYLDNPYGANSAGPGAVNRRGVGAIDPVSGMALSWNPGAPATIGGKVIYATPEGVWFGSDSAHFDGEYHRGLAFAPL